MESAKKEEEKEKDEEEGEIIDLNREENICED